jgi:hypothetical protein
VIGYLDCFSGISGDKFLGALVDAGLDLAVIADAIEALLPGEAEVTSERVVSAGIAATRVAVGQRRAQPARRWADIRTAVESADSLPGAVRERTLAVFAVLAAAEAHVHGTTVDEVHFHEVGAVDSVADVVGTCAGLEALGMTRLVSSPVAVGSGTVVTAHGVLPVPAPATAALLEGLPVVAGPATGELTTPTGAALVRVLADAFGPMPAMTPTRSGYGAGTRTLQAADGPALRVPNVLRLMLGEAEARLATRPDDGFAGDAAAVNGLSAEDIVMLRTNIDHVSGERIAFALENALAAGALDAWQRPIGMKKGRIGTEVTVLAKPDDAEVLARLLVRDTGTLGVRMEPMRRLIAEREALTVLTELGEVRVKRGPGETLRPEHDDLARLARDNDLPIEQVERTVRDALSKAGDD